MTDNELRTIASTQYGWDESESDTYKVCLLRHFHYLCDPQDFPVQDEHASNFGASYATCTDFWNDMNESKKDMYPIIHGILDNLNMQDLIDHCNPE